MILFTNPFDQYIQWWQHALSGQFETFLNQPSLLKGFGLFMERYLETKRIGDRMMEEMWRNLRLPPLEEVTRIHERLNLLEARWMSLHEEVSREKEAVLENLQSLKETFENVQRQLLQPSSQPSKP